MDAELREAERRWRTGDGDDESFEALQLARSRAGRLALCVECQQAEDARKPDGLCECLQPLCGPCHVARMEHGHQHVHDEDCLVACCRKCFVSWTWHPDRRAWPAPVQERAWAALHALGPVVEARRRELRGEGS